MKKNKLFFAFALLCCLLIPGCQKNIDYTGKYVSDSTSIFLKEKNKYEIYFQDAYETGKYQVDKDQIKLTPEYETTAKTGKIANKTITLEDVIYTRVEGLIVDFDLDGGSFVPTQVVLKGQTVNKPATPSRVGDYFVDWFISPTSSVRFDFNAPISKNTTVYARFEEFCQVTLDKNGGTGGTDIISPQVGKAMPSEQSAPQKDGVAFVGYFDSAGKQYYHPDMRSASKWDKNYWTTLYASWIPLDTQFNVTIDFDFDVEPIQVTAQFGQLLPTIEVPDRPDFIFLGVYDSSDKQYYNEFGVGVATWDKNTDATLSASWRRNDSYKVTFNKTGGSGGDDFVLAFFEEEMPYALAPDRLDYTFLGYFDSEVGGKQYYYPDMSSTNLWDKNNIVANYVLYARWIESDYATPGLDFVIEGGVCYVSGYSGSQLNVIVPQTKWGAFVVGIKEKAFAPKPDNSNAKILTVTLPSVVQYIGDEAFSWCQSLVNISLPLTLKEVGTKAFFYCTSLKSLHFGDTLTTIKSQAFSNCLNISQLKLPLSLDILGDEVFRNWISKQTVIFLGRNQAGENFSANWQKSSNAKIIYLV